MSKSFSGVLSGGKTISGVPSAPAANIDGGAAGEVLYQNGVSSTTFTNAADGVLQSDGTTPFFAALSLSGSRVTGTLPLTKGGTGVTTLTGITGTGKIVADNTPTLITPVLGTATATTILGTVGADLNITQSTTGKRIKLTTLDTSIQLFKGATNVGEFNSSGATFPANVTVTGVNANVTLGNLELDGTGQGQYQAVCTDDNDAYYASTASGKYIRSQFTDLTNNAYYGLNASAEAEISTSTAKNIVFKPNSVNKLTVKSSGVVQIPNYISSVLSTDASGNIAAASTTGTAGTAIVLATSPTINTPTLVQPAIGVATGTSLSTGDSALSTTGLTSTYSSDSFPVNANTPLGSFSLSRYHNTSGGGTFYVGKGNSGTPAFGSAVDGRGVIWTDYSAPIDIITNNINAITAKSTGQLQFWQHTNAAALKTDSSGNVSAASTTGTAGTAIVLATSPTITTPTLVQPNIGAATGTTLTLSAMPKMSAYLGSNQTGVSGLVKLNIDTKYFDIGTYFNTSTHKYTPLVAGYYAVSARLETTAVSAIVQAIVYKNGADVVAANGSRSGAGGGTFQTGCSGFIDMNGTTDYLEMYIYTASSTDVISGFNSSIFNVYMIP
jgi:hypothetical protein